MTEIFIFKIGHTHAHRKKQCAVMLVYNRVTCARSPEEKFKLQNASTKKLGNSVSFVLFYFSIIGSMDWPTACMHTRTKHVNATQTHCQLCEMWVFTYIFRLRTRKCMHFSSTVFVQLLLNEGINTIWAIPNLIFTCE